MLLCCLVDLCIMQYALESYMYMYIVRSNSMYIVGMLQKHLKPCTAKLFCTYFIKHLITGAD